MKNNNGEFQNRGFEFEVRANIIDRRDFRWDISINISYNKNKIVSLPDNGLERNRKKVQREFILGVR